MSALGHSGPSSDGLAYLTLLHPNSGHFAGARVVLVHALAGELPDSLVDAVEDAVARKDVVKPKAFERVLRPH
ncbi:hypothetical protein GCM10007857_29090 [Bradyrhizobium iriomotense]|uniref:Uncharacterized protein n=1 Tax=Bradyrhizobium iriomotense TaxID=441950 RepID=A0ABQ6B1Z7_9BRAD|nr:hypothetical protein GCM10007857_29090 [Bradyrhizobium iriomotense]